MLGSLKKRLRNNIFKLRSMLQLEKSMLMQGSIRADQILAKGKLRKLSDAGFGVFSQTDEDGILSWLIDRIGNINNSFIEFGVHDYRESNTRFLLMSRNWRGLIIDGDTKNIATIQSDEISTRFDIQVVASFITKDNIAGIIQNAKFQDRVGILSTDIDGVDYWVLEKVGIEADIIVVEYNDFLGDLPVTVPYSPSFSRLKEDPHGIYWGASLSAFKHLLEAKGYKFVGSNILGVNAFFVHADHSKTISKWLEQIVAHPCQMREARDGNGQISRKQYRDFKDKIANKTLIRVDTGAQVSAGEVCRS
jgi:hypothetical protein